MRNETTEREALRLVELGLDPATADLQLMTFDPEPKPLKKGEVVYLDGGGRRKQTAPQMKTIPQWTMSALFDILPNYIEVDDKIKSQLHIDKTQVSYIALIEGDGYKIKKYTFQAQYKDMMKNFYHTVIWLIESGFLKDKCVGGR